MDFIKYVEKEKKKARIKNVEEVRKDIDKEWVKEKINKYLEEMDYVISYEEVRQSILTNFVSASHFMKPPGKQNISEKLCAQILNLKKLPPSGNNCIRFNDAGDIVHTASGGNTKSADFYYKEHYMTQKYTNESGGSQDNQRNDVIDFLKRGSIKHKVGAIVDGYYWEKYRPILKDMFKNNPNVLITSVTEITENDKL